VDTRLNKIRHKTAVLILPCFSNFLRDRERERERENKKRAAKEKEKKKMNICPVSYDFAKNSAHTTVPDSY